VTVHEGDYDSPAARLLGDLAAAELDLEDVVSAVDCLKAIDDSDMLAMAAYHALAVGLYSRLFSSTRRHRVDDLLEEVIRGGPPTARGLHEDVIGYRNNHLAHVLSDLDQVGIRVQVQTEPGGGMRRSHQAWAGGAYAVTGPALSHFRDLADALRQVVAMEREVLQARVDQELAAMTPEELLVLPPTRYEGQRKMPVNGWRTERRVKAPRPPKKARRR